MNIKCLAARHNKSAAINSYGELFLWGSSKNRSLMTAAGNGLKDNLKLPTLFGTEELIFTKVAVGVEHVAAITDDGRVFTMGTSEHGKLGHPERQMTAEEEEKEKQRYKVSGYKPGGMDRSQPAIGFVEGDLAGKKVVQVACGAKHTVAVTDDGEVYTWGYGRTGALGHSNTDSVLQPKKVDSLSGIVRVDCGTAHTIVMDANGKLYSFGDNTYG